MDVMDILQGQLPEGMLDQLTQQIGGADKTATATAATSALETLVVALTKNASTPDGASALANALDRDHDGSLLDNITDFLSGNTAAINPRAANGSGILNHVLGEKKAPAVDAISKVSGLEPEKTDSLLATLAPIVMGALGKAKNSTGMDVSDLVSMLSGVVSSKQTQGGSPIMGMITGFLDKDNDGSIVDDIAGNIMGRFFGKK